METKHPLRTRSLGWCVIACLGAGSVVGDPPSPGGTISLSARPMDGGLVVSWQGRNLLATDTIPTSVLPVLIPAYALEESSDLREWRPTDFASSPRVGGAPPTLEFRAPWHAEARFYRAVELRDFAALDLTAAELSGADLAHLNLRGARLRGARLVGTSLVGTDLEEADLEGAVLDGADLALANLHRANLTGASLRRANLAEARVTRVNLTNADLRGAVFPPWQGNPGVIFRNTLLPDGSLVDDPDKWRLMIAVITTGAEGLDLSEADLSEMDLSGTELPGAVLTRTDLRRANLSHADLTGADLSKARLDGASLTYAYLRGADLSQASLTGADLTGADLTDARLPTNPGLTRP